MNKKFAAATIALLMIIGLLPTFAVPVAQAQIAAPPGCVLVQPSVLTDLPRVDVNGNYLGVPTRNPGAYDPFCVFMHPGVTDSYKPGWSHTLDTLWGTQGTVAQTRELFDEYLDYAILASGSDSIGDLQFDFTIPAGITVGFIDIYVPPEFEWLAPTREEAIWTDITNDYQYIWSLRRSVYDPIAPGWVRVRIGMDEWWGNTMTIGPGTYHVRLFDLRAPEVAGLYHFKIYADGVSIGAGNYPVIVVKTELNPAFAMVGIRTHLGFAPPFVSGKVQAVGTTPEGRAVEGIAYWSPPHFAVNSIIAGEPGALYWTVLFGLAAGTYEIHAWASGYGPTTTERFTLSPGQSFEINLVLFPSPIVAVTVWSKHGTGAIPWHNLWQLPYGTNNPAIPPNVMGPWRDMMLELYDADNALVGFWVSNVFGPNTALYHPNPAPFTGLAPKTIPRSNELMGLHDDGAVIPTATSYHAVLVDNFDVLGIARGYASTHWDGHVWWDTADYVEGMTPGQYTVEGFVTGYIMDEADAFQRSFVLANVATSIVFDLRRTNWIETVIHMPLTAPAVSGPTTLALTAEDAAGTERGAAAFLVTPAMTLADILAGLPPSYDGADASSTSIFPVPLYAGGIVLEGWNAVFPNVGGRGAARNINTKDYGLNPTPSSHSAGAVTLAGNPYTVKLYMADMGVPYIPVPGAGWFWIVGGDPQVSVFLCNSPVSLSFKVQNALIWISLRSVDFEVPAHSRPWTFPGSEIWVEFVDTATGEPVDWLDPTLWALFQDPGTTVPGFVIPGAPLLSFGYTPFDVDNVNPAGLHEHLGVLYTGNDYTSPTIGGGAPIYRALIDLRPTRLPPGEYTFNVYTHGYIMRRTFPFNIPATGAADIEADLIQGGQVRVIMDFKHEAIATAFNGFVRMEVFNAEGTLVGATVYGQAEPNFFTTGAGTGAYLPYVPPIDWMLSPGPAGATGLGYNPVLGFDGLGTPVPYGVWNPAPPPWVVYPSSSRAQRGFFSSLFYGVPAAAQLWAGYSATAPSDANRLLVAPGGAAAFDVYGFYWYHGGPARTWAGGWPTTNGWNSGPSGYTGIQWDYGIKGSVDVPGLEGGGLYTIKIWAFDPYGPNGVFDLAGPSDDWRMYHMAWDLTNVQIPWGGATTLFVTMNNMASLRGTVRWFDMFGNLRALPWAQISASPGPSTDSIPAYSSGNGAIGAGASDPSGAFIMWLPAGAHDVSVSTSEAPQAWSSSAPTQNAEYSVVVSDGWVGGGDTQLSGSGVPIPELPSAMLPLGLFAVLAASVWLLRKKTVNVPVLMK